MRVVVPLLVTAAIVGAVLWWRHGPRPAEPVHRSMREGEPADPAIPDPEPVATSATRELVQEEAAPTPSDPSETDRDGDPMETVEGDREIVGTFIAIDERGGEHCAEEGTFCPRLWNGRSVRPPGNPVPVIAGSFRMMVPADAMIGVERVVLGGRVARVEETRRYGPNTPNPVVVRVQWLPQVILRVVDARTGADLSDLTVVYASPRWSRDWMYRGTARIVKPLIERGMSPLVLSAPVDHPDLADLRFPDPADEQLLWIGTRGYAWQSRRVGFVAGGESRVELEPGGSLEVNMEGPFVNAAMLRLRSGGGKLGDEGKLVIESILDGKSSFLFDGLPAGDYRARAEIGNDPVVLGEIAGTVLAGQSTTVTLVVHPLPEDHAPVPLSGTLRLSNAWNFSNPFAFVLEQVAPPGATGRHYVTVPLGDQEGAAPGIHSWNAGLVLPGRYRLESQLFQTRFEFEQMIEIGPHGRTDVEIVLGDPADVFVRVLEEDTEETLGPDDEFVLCGSTKTEEATRTGSVGRFKWNAAAQAFVLRAPAGEIALQVAGTKFGACVPARVTLVPGRNDVTVHVRRNSGMTLCLETTSVRVSWDDVPVSAIKVERIGPGEPGQVASGWDLYCRVVATPGRYRITVPAPPGFEPIPPFEIEVPQGDFVEHVIQLVRRQ